MSHLDTFYRNNKMSASLEHYIRDCHTFDEFEERFPPTSSVLNTAIICKISYQLITLKNSSLLLPRTLSLSQLTSVFDTTT